MTGPPELGVLVDRCLVGHGHTVQCTEEGVPLSAEPTSAVLLTLDTGGRGLTVILSPEAADDLATSLTRQAVLTRQHRDDGVPLTGGPGHSCLCVESSSTVDDTSSTVDDPSDRVCTCGHDDCGAC